MLIDPLTGAYTRAALQPRLQEEVERALRYGSSFALLLLDLDHFKSINDAFGHTCGDRVLVEMVNRIRSAVRSADILFRYGGDEFVLLLPNSPRKLAQHLAQRLLDAIRLEPFPGDPPLSISLSVGVAGFPEDGQTPETLFDSTDLRLYTAKRRGRGQVVAESQASGALLAFSNPSRLMERDAAMQALNRFLQQLGERSPGLLLITGQPGAGRSQFLAEAGKAARLRGYEVVSLRGGPALASRAYGVFSEGFIDWDLPSPMIGADAFSAALQEIIAARGRTGLLITIDDFFDVDWASSEMIKQLLVSPNLPRLALAVTTLPEHSSRMLLIEPPLSEQIELQPLSLPGLQVWMRSVMQWEADSEFVHWLYEGTRGLPRLVERVINCLVERGVLQNREKGWHLDPEFSRTDLQSCLQSRSYWPANSLPIPPTHFVGRFKEIQSVKDLLAEKRLVTICGTGGMGKTRLSLQVAAELYDTYPQGAHFIPLASVSSPDFLVSAIADSLKINFYSAEPAQVQLINYLHEKRLLLVLDNFEHLVQGSELISEIIQKTPYVRVLVTSRERLNVRGEAIIELQGMSFPTHDPLSQPEIYSAVQLFIISARHHKPDFVLEDGDRQYLVRICRMLEGLPLGIELAAGWIGMLTLKEIADEIEASLDFLVSPMRDLPDRHRSLRAVFDHSWSLLSSEEQAVYQRLAVFKGGFRREAAQDITGGDLAVLMAFKSQSLLHQTSAGRFAMHEVLNHYAEEKLAKDIQEQTSAQHKHCQYYTAFLEQCLPALRAANQTEALQAIAEEIGNIRAAWKFALEQADIQALDRALSTIASYYGMRGRLQEGRQTLEMALEKLSAAPSGKPDPQTLLEGKLALRLAGFYSRLGMTTQAEKMYEQSQQALLPFDQPKEKAVLLMGMGALAERMDDYTKAENFSRQALTMFEQIKDQHGMAQVLNELGVIAYMQGDYTLAKQYYQQSNDRFQAVNDRWGTARTLINLGNIDCEIGNFTEARKQYSASLAVCREMDDKVGMAVAINNLGDIAREQHMYTEASRLLKESIDLCRENGDVYGLSISMNNLGDVATRLGDYERARELFEASLKINIDTSNRLGQGYNLYHLGLVAQACGSYPEAWGWLHRALALGAEIPSPPFQLETVVEIAALLLAQNLPGEAALLASLVSENSASPIGAKETARSVLDTCQARLTPEVLDSQRKAGQALALEDAVRSILSSSEGEISFP